MTFLAKTKSPEEWKVVAGAISTLVDEATFEATAEGISFRGIDPLHIGMIDIFWSASGFENYVCDSAAKFGVRVDEFAKLLKRAGKDDSIELALSDDSMLHVKMQNGYRREYKTRLIESSASSTPLPKLNFNAKVTLAATTLDRLISDVAVVSDYVTFNAEKDKLVFAGRGDSGEANITLESGDEWLEELAVKEDSKGMYSLDYVSKMVRAVAAAGGPATVEWSSKMPIRLGFQIAQVGRIHFYLAPRVQD